MAETATDDHPRIEIIQSGIEVSSEDFGADVRSGLTATPKRLSCRYLYDAAGSALFEQICALPEYYITRAETEILTKHAREIAAHFGDELTFVELGSGSGVKTQLIVAAILAKDTRLTWVPIDISETALVGSAKDMADRFEALSVVGIAGDYSHGIDWMRMHDQRKLVAWLGSNVGNYDRESAREFLQGVRSAMTTDDRLLIGIDLRKDKEVLEAAYDDAAGVTARFSQNMLVRINAELGGNFDVPNFDHVAKYDDVAGRVAIGLVSRKQCNVRIDKLGLDVKFAAGEYMHTEDSVKYSIAEIDLLAQYTGFAIEQQWFDTERRFSLSLCVPQ
ncbi:MAG: L-histidine N(alpha)-methyltransferase [Planctomycetota bacterium]